MLYSINRAAVWSHKGLSVYSVMITRATALASLAIAAPPSQHLAIIISRTKASSCSRQQRHQTQLLAASDYTDTTKINSSPSLSWKFPWESRRDTREVLFDVGYDTVAMENFFKHRPERVWARFVQVGTTVYFQRAPRINSRLKYSSYY